MTDTDFGLSEAEYEREWFDMHDDPEYTDVDGTEVPLPPEPEEADVSAERRATEQIIWCINLLRSNGYTVTAPDSGATFHVRSDAPDTSKAVEPKIREGSLQAVMLHYYERLPEHGFTDDEMELQTGRTHQSVSACRNTLVRKGLVTDSGRRRRTRSGNDAIVWLRTEVEAIKRWTA